MCGIAGHFSFGDSRPAVPVCQGLLVGQEVRGRSAAGVAYQTEARPFNVIKRAGSASVFARRDMTDTNWQDLAASPWALMHARATTQGTERHNENNHPVVAGGWLVTHNGQVANDDSLIAHYGIERPAEVDTVAINLVLSQGQTAEESLAHLATLGGSATFAAWAEARPDEVILARVNGPLLYLHHSREGILYWSSDNAAIFRSSRRGIGGLNFTNITALPQNTALVMNRNGRVARYGVARAPFFRPKPRVHVVAGPVHTASTPTASTPTPSTSGGVDTRPGTLSVIEGGKTYRSEAVRRALARRQSIVEMAGTVDGEAQKKLSDWIIAGTEPIFPVRVGVVIPKADYIRLNKPYPDFSMGHTNLVLDPPPMDFTMLTPYGTWVQKGESFEFKGAKRVKPWWARSVNTPLGVEVVLPASVELQEALEGTMALEPVELVSNGIHIHVGMCPWCGILSRLDKWFRWGIRCGWCHIRSYRKED